MNKLKIIVLLFLVLFSACQKDQDFKENILNSVPVSGSFEALNNTHEVFAKVLAMSLADINVRLFLQSEIAKQFTSDYDILFNLIKDKEIETTRYGLIRFSNLLKMVARNAGIDYTGVQKSLLNYVNLQISSPVYFEEWNAGSTVPLVVSLPIDYQEEMGTAVKAFDVNGNEVLVKEDEIKNPILLVRKAERVDDKGMMRVDPDGFVIPEEERVFTAGEAYEIADKQLKSAESGKSSPVIEVLDQVDFQHALELRRITSAEVVNKTRLNPGLTIEPGLKSASSTIETPGNFSVHPAGPYTIQVNWSQVEGATAYEIFRQYSTYPNYLLATVGADQINYYDQYLSCGSNYIYSVRAVNANGNTSALTNGLETYASWRTNGNRDIIDKIYIDTDCWKWCCGLFDGKIELQYKTSYLLGSGNSVVAYPSSGVNSLGQKSKDAQKDKWCTYNHYLFPWDVRNSSYSYRFVLIEDDGDGNGTTIKLGDTFKIQLIKIISYTVTAGIEFKIAEKDESFGEIIVLYWERKNGVNASSDGYNLMPDHGKARMYLKQ